MQKREHPLQKFNSISEALKAMDFPPPQHPLIALINGLDSDHSSLPPLQRHVLSFYKVSFRPYPGGSLLYGQTRFDYKEGGLFFGAPNQIVSCNEADVQASGMICLNQQITLLIHPEFLLNYSLAKKIKQYNFFSYSVNEALHLSEKEKEVILSLLRNIEDELNSRIDEFSHDVIISQIELLLNYAHRYYKRQFITRKTVNHTLLQNLEQILDEHFDQAGSLNRGIPTVQYLASRLNLSPSYLSDMLRSLTGQNTQQHIHNKLIEKAKEKLSGTNLSVSEIAYQLGFEQPQSFSRLFKAKASLSPLEFRERFN
ncbi:helix-turn-helix domain-containing protein [Arcticibacter sp. MXS-1]|uniref:helix-turn-helix domain-containing protein n=1 Tax=Arcticibacter sp. MXS-1 TaxID=3341726 RepID=UPI0035A85C9B